MAGQGQGSGLVDGSSVHACARVLASRDRGVAVLYAGYRRSRLAARCGGEEAMAVAGSTGGANGLLLQGRHESREQGLGVLELC